MDRSSLLVVLVALGATACLGFNAFSKGLHQLSVNHHALQSRATIIQHRVITMAAASDGNKDQLARMRAMIGPEELQEFFRALPQARLDKNKKVLTLSDNTVFLGTYELNEIYVRDCYSDLYELVMNSDIHSTLITGTPNIGKSICAFYFMWRLLSEGKTVIYQLDDEYYRLGDGGVFRGTWETFFDARFFDDKDVWCLIDPIEKAQHRGAGRCVAFVTLYPKRYRHYLNGRASRHATTFIMSPWSYAEVMQLHSMEYQHLDKQLVNELYNQWGGNVRYVLQFATDKSQQAQLWTGIDQCSRLKLRSLSSISVYYPPASMANCDFVELALHIVSKHNIYSETMWASSYILNVYLNCRSTSISDEAEVLAKTFDNTPGLQYLQRTFFKRTVHSYMIRSGGDLVLQGTALADQKFNFKATLHRVSLGLTGGVKAYNDSNDANKSAASIERYTYYIAGADVFSSVDSFALVNGVLYIFQLTETWQPSVVQADIVNILKFVQPHNKHQDYAMVFIAPAHIASAFEGCRVKLVDSCSSSSNSDDAQAEVQWPKGFRQQWITTTRLD
eukprot:20413-Heterococcus_DN1.PRE.1